MKGLVFQHKPGLHRCSISRLAKSRSRIQPRRVTLPCAQRDRSRRSAPVDYDSDGWDPTPYDYPPTRGGRRGYPYEEPADDFSALSPFTNALIGGAFILGIGAGVFFTSEVTLEPSNVASTEIVDRKTPNSEICLANGFSSMVFDQRLFVSFNPFNVYVAQPELKPGCILRRSNFNVLEKRKLITKEKAETCKKGMNTFAFVGDLNNNPEISCVYHSEDAENLFMVDPRKAVMGDGVAKP